MRVIGVVCEYNPFHNGHAYHLRRCRELAGEDCTVICVMSGDFVQRGEPALYSKFARAEAACLGGADLVVELPLPWSLSSAEAFARGGVSLLDRLGTDSICFGSETDDIEALNAIAALLNAPVTQAEIREAMRLDATLSYANARQIVLQEQIGETSRLLSRPNDILGIEYIRAIGESGSFMKALAIKRIGSEHDMAEGAKGFHSASELRRMLLADEDIDGEVPAVCAEIYKREREQGRQQNRGLMEKAILSRLRMLNEDAFAELPDAADGLGSRIYKAIQSESSLEDIQMAAKTKRYALSRIRRICMCACLGIQANANKGVPPYARVLAMNEKGRAHLASLRKKAEIPVLIKPVAVDKFSKECQELFALGARAHSFYTLGFGLDAQYHPSEDWMTGPMLCEIYNF